MQTDLETRFGLFASVENYSTSDLNMSRLGNCLIALVSFTRLRVLAMCLFQRRNVRVRIFP